MANNKDIEIVFICQRTNEFAAGIAGKILERYRDYKVSIVYKEHNVRDDSGCKYERSTILVNVIYFESIRDYNKRVVKNDDICDNNFNLNLILINQNFVSMIVYDNIILESISNSNYEFTCTRLDAIVEKYKGRITKKLEKETVKQESSKQQYDWSKHDMKLYNDFLNNSDMDSFLKINPLYLRRTKVLLELKDVVNNWCKDQTLNLLALNSHDKEIILDCCDFFGYKCKETGGDFYITL